MKYWIKERQNPQLGTYFQAMGQISIEQAKRIEDTRYGVNIMHSFDTEGAYKARIEELKSEGANFN